MKLAMRFISSLLLVIQPGMAARCTTEANAKVIEEYESFVKKAEPGMAERFMKDHLSSAKSDVRDRLMMQFRSGAIVRWNVTDDSVNRGIVDANGTVLNWIGAARIRDTSIAELKNVLEDYDRCGDFYQPLMFDCRAAVDSGAARDVTFGLHHEFRAASIFPQSYTFAVKARTEYKEETKSAANTLWVHSKALEIRESDSGVRGRFDFLQPYHDHGVLWGLNSYWRARAEGPDLYVEYEIITLHRSAEQFVCRVADRKSTRLNSSH